MVGLADFLASSPAADLIHLSIGAAVVLLAGALFRWHPVAALVLLLGFAAFVPIKEFLLDTNGLSCGLQVCMAQSGAAATVDATMYVTGAAVAAPGAILLPPWWAVALAAIVLILGVGIGLWSGQPI